MCAAVYRLRHLVKATEVTAGLAESNGSLLSGLWRDSLHVTCGLTACTLGSAPGPTLGNEYGKTLPLSLVLVVVVVGGGGGGVCDVKMHYLVCWFFCEHRLRSFTD